MTEVLSFEGEQSLDPFVVGAKAARLSEAFQKGIPVLPGVVVPVSVSAELLKSAAACTPEEGVHAARFKVMESELPCLPDLEVSYPFLHGDLVVRSSSPLEDAGEYSGAFSSYLGIRGNEEANTATRGVWASSLLEQEEGKPLEEPAGMAVLIQPEIHPRFSGTAQVYETKITIVTVEGSSAALMAGWASGETTHLPRDADHVSIPEDSVNGLLDTEALTLVTGLALQVLDKVNADLIEWAIVDGMIYLLQAKTAGSSEHAEPTAGDNDGLVIPKEACAVAEIVYTLAGDLGDQLLSPLMLSQRDARARLLAQCSFSTDTSYPPSTLEGWRELREHAEAASRDLWASSGLTLTSQDLIRELRGGSIDVAVEQLGSLGHYPLGALERLVGALGGIASAMFDQGALARLEDFWALSSADLEGFLGSTSDFDAESCLSRTQDQRRHSLMRWEPFVYSTVMAHGRKLQGEAISPGIGAGRVLYVEGLPASTTPFPRMILVAPNPIPQLAPLLWGAAGLVTFGGSEAAHLVEVARSVGVPTVIGCEEATMRSLIRDDGGLVLAAVNGDRGVIAVHPS
jgi:phosphohistidine swiveling domain-containing protein